MELSRLEPETREGAQAFINKYNPALTIDNFHPKGIKFEDQLGQVVVVVAGTIGEQYIKFTKAHADIFVVVQDSTLLGWTHKNSVIDAEDQYIMPVGSLSKMPRELKFAQECPHLSYFGGWKFGDDKYLYCFGCGKQVVK